MDVIVPIVFVIGTFFRLFGHCLVLKPRKMGRAVLVTASAK
jgi:hypothetical protein